MVKRKTAERIADAALDILVGEGPEAVSMRRVAEAVGVTPMAIYRHYPNREALLRAVAADSLQELGAQWAARQDPDPVTRIYGLLTDFLDFALGRPNLYLFLMAERREQAPHFPEDVHSGETLACGVIVTAVEQGMREGTLKPDDPLEVALALTAPAQGLVQRYLGGRIAMPESEFRALCRRTTERILHGITAQASSQSSAWPSA
ncbi:TetR/AcrR family transcriptional regulator [Streptomyces inhibens]|uniref:TetR/AcrR family transcriptional regulator n=1 Tax=Streptomyces inhibens TaxID=2293571 RepID=UPI0036CDC96D